MDVLELVCDLVVVGVSGAVAAFYLDVWDLVLVLRLIDFLFILICLFDDFGLCLRLDHDSLANSDFEFILIFVDDNFILLAQLLLLLLFLYLDQDVLDEVHIEALVNLLANPIS